MKMLRRFVCLLLCAALFLTLLAGCGKQEEPAEDFVYACSGWSIPRRHRPTPRF